MRKINQKCSFIEPLEARQLFSAGWASTATPNTTHTIYVSKHASVKTVAQAVAKSKNNTRILFRRGETFKTAGVTETNSNIFFGAYGKGADPIIAGANSSKAAGSILSLKGSKVRIESLRFTDQDNSTKFTAVSTVTSRNVTITHCLADASLNNFVYAGAKSSGTTVSFSSAPQGLGAYFVYSALGSKYLDVNHCFMAGSRTEHGIRTHTDHFRITRNRILQPVRANSSIKSCLCVREGSDGVIARNYFSGSQVTILGPLASRKNATLTNVVYEHNKCDSAKQFALFEGASGIVIRNNTIKKLHGTGSVISVMKSKASRPGPSGSITNNYCDGQKLTSGNSARLKIKGNALV